MMVKNGILCAAACLLILLTGISQASADDTLVPPDEFDLYGQALEAHQQGDNASALAALQQAVDMGSHHPGLLSLLAGAHALAGDAPRAMELLDEVDRIGFFAEIDSSDWFTPLHDDPAFLKMAARLRENASPISHSTTAFTLPEKELIPEGMAFDERSGNFFIGSLASSRILRIHANGEYEDFYPAETPAWPSIGIKVDPRSENLWVCRRSQADSTAFGIFVYDLESGQESRRFLLEPGHPHLLNDLVIARSGDVFITDSDANALWRIPPGASQLQRYLPDLRVRFPNGIALSEDEQFVYIAHAMGILRVEIQTRTVEKLKCADGVSLVGLDGMYRYGKDLLGVQNGILPFRAVRFHLEPDGLTVNKATILERAHLLFEQIPTTGAIVGDSFYYIANSQMRLLDENFQFPQPDALSDVVILQVELE